MESGGPAVAVLGPLQVEGLGTYQARPRTVLGALALDANILVPADRLIDLLWPAELPRHPAKALQVVVSRLRGSMADCACEVETYGAGYRLTVDPSDLDAAHFDDLVAGDAPSDTVAAARFDEALGLWRGAVLEDLELLAQHPRVSALNEQRLWTLQRWASAAGALEDHGSIILRLTPVCEGNPYRDDLALQLMRSLAAAGRIADALQLGERVTSRLARDLDLRPSHDLVDYSRKLRSAKRSSVKAANAESLAGAVAYALSDFDHAAEQHRLALSALGNEPSRPRIDQLIGLARALRAKGSPEHEWYLAEAFEQAVVLRDTDAELSVAVQLRPAGWISDIGAIDQVYVDRMRGALARSKGRADGRRAIVQADLAGALLHTTDTDEAALLFDEALGFARAAGTPAILRRVLLNALVKDARDDLTEQIGLSEELIRLSEEAGDYEGMAFGARMLYVGSQQLGDHEKLERAAQLDQSLADRLDHNLFQWGRVTLATSHALLHGQLDRAEELAGEGLALGMGNGFTEGRAVGLYGGQLFELRRLQARDHGLLEALVAMISQQPDFPVWVAGGLVLEAEHARTPQVDQRIEDRVRERLPLSRGLAWSSEMAALIDASRSIGRLDLMSDVYDDCAPYASRWTYSGAATSGPIAMFLGKVQCDLGNLHRGVELLDQAREMCNEMDAPIYRTICELELAMTMEAGDPLRVSLLAGARSQAHQLGAQTVVNAIDAGRTL